MMTTVSYPQLMAMGRNGNDGASPQRRSAGSSTCESGDASAKSFQTAMESPAPSLAMVYSAGENWQNWNFSGETELEYADRHVGPERLPEPPKRQRSAFDLFFEHERARHVLLEEFGLELGDHPPANLSVEDVKAILDNNPSQDQDHGLVDVISRHWKNIDLATLTAFERVAGEDKARYEREMKRYKAELERRRPSEPPKSKRLYSATISGGSTLFAAKKRRRSHGAPMPQRAAKEQRCSRNQVMQRGRARARREQRRCRIHELESMADALRSRYYAALERMGEPVPIPEPKSDEDILAEAAALVAPPAQRALDRIKQLEGEVVDLRSKLAAALEWEKMKAAPPVVRPVTPPVTPDKVSKPKIALTDTLQDVLELTSTAAPAVVTPMRRKEEAVEPLLFDTELGNDFFEQLDAEFFEKYLDASFADGDL